MQTYGIDWLTLSLPIEPPHSTGDETRDGAREPVQGTLSGSVTVPSPQGDVKVWLHAYRSRGEWRCSVSCNPSRIADPAGYGLIDPRTFLQETLLLLAQVIDEQGIRPLLSPDDWQVRRIDLARDFCIESAPSAVIEALRSPRRTYVRTGILYFDPTTGRTHSLYFGNRSRLVKVYDQQAAHPRKEIPAGSLRWEAELRQSYLKRRGILTVADLSVPTLDALVASLWTWANCGVEFTIAADIPRELDRLYRAGHLSAVKARTLWGDLNAEAAGFSWPMSPKTREAYDRLKARLGLTATTDLRAALRGGAETARGRLDWLTGTEVIVTDNGAVVEEAAA